MGDSLLQDDIILMLTNNSGGVVVDFDMATIEKAREKMVERAHSNRSCFTHWHKVAEQMQVRQPESRVLRFYPFYTSAVLEGVESIVEKPLNKIIEQIRSFGNEHGYPLFLRNSLSNSPYKWSETCFISKEATDEQVLQQIITITKDWSENSRELALFLIVQKYIPTEPVFHCFEEMPVSPSFVLFATDGEATGVQPYWPARAIGLYDPDIENWEEVLASIATPSLAEQDWMKRYGEALTKELGGTWSMQFLRGELGELWLVNMTEGEDQFKSAEYRDVVKKNGFYLLE